MPESRGLKRRPLQPKVQSGTTAHTALLAKQDTLLVPPGTSGPSTGGVTVAANTCSTPGCGWGPLGANIQKSLANSTSLHVPSQLTNIGDLPHTKPCAWGTQQ